MLPLSQSGNTEDIYSPACPPTRPPMVVRPLRIPHCMFHTFLGGVTMSHAAGRTRCAPYVVFLGWRDWCSCSVCENCHVCLLVLVTRGAKSYRHLSPCPCASTKSVGQACHPPTSVLSCPSWPCVCGSMHHGRGNRTIPLANTSDKFGHLQCFRAKQFGHVIRELPSHQSMPCRWARSQLNSTRVR